MRKLLSKVLPGDIKAFLRKKILGVEVDTYFFSQCGEDAILDSIFRYVTKIENGFYIDVGAYHPFKGSNTYLLYRSGWKGINIDPNSYSITLFNKYRPKDINLLMGIAKFSGDLDYYMISEKSTMNTFSKSNLEQLGILKSVSEIRKIPTAPLSDVAKKYLATGQKVNFLNIDAEGFEIEILESNNWDVIYPEVIAIEQNDVTTLKDVMESTVCEYLAQKKYVPVAKNVIVNKVATVIYIKQ